MYFYNIKINQLEAMKISIIFKSLFLAVLLTAIANGCSVSDEIKSNRSVEFLSKNGNQIIFVKSPEFDWSNKIVEVSFEDALQEFLTVGLVSEQGNKMGYSLTANNMKQGLTIKLMITDTTDNSQQVNELMIEPFDLVKGKNDFLIGCNTNKAFIIY